jgi:hypothetical protein
MVGMEEHNDAGRRGCTAMAMNLALPPAVLLRADRVFD